MDNFNGGEAAWSAYALPLSGTTQPPEPPPTGETMKFIVQTAGLKVRSNMNASNNNSLIRQLPVGAVFEAVRVETPAAGVGQAWAVNAAGEYACICMGATQHMRSA
jgi:hypothetical protein